MIRKKIVLKTMSIYLLLQMILDITLPTISYALTSGPTAPEATSFEPVDTTDMVNQLTGDFTYNIPLLEVPGPSGGYPLSLSYHAGIQPNEEASWVGLGWALNPGAINRNVNGFPDDHKNVQTVDRFFWEGGTRRTVNVGVSVGVHGISTSLNAGLSFSQDTYQGFGVGGHLGFSFGAGIGGANSPFNLNVSSQVGIQPYGGFATSTGISVGVSKAIDDVGSSLNAGIGINAGNSGVGFSGGVSVSASNGQTNPKESRTYQRTRNISLVGSSIGSSGGGASFSLGGANASFNNSKRGNVSTSTSSFGASIPVLPGLSLSFGKSTTRYWIDEIENVDTNGAMYFADFDLDREFLDTHAYDTYTLMDYDTVLQASVPLFADPMIEENPDRMFGGSFPNFDDFQVHAQGINGNFRPYFFRKNLLRRNVFEINSNGVKEYDITHYPLTPDTLNQFGFRFNGDFSNRFFQDHVSFGVGLGTYAYPVYYDFNIGQIFTGENGDDGYVNNRLAGSKYIEYFTNEEIKNGIATSQGFIESQATGLRRNDLPDDQVGGFQTINESGVTYHFSLPVCSYGEILYSENTGLSRDEDGFTFNSIEKPTEYAFSWLLTGITGPDYVDRGPDGNPDGILNEYDWGYWVSFEYGKWTENYTWRNPSEGYHVDLDSDFRNFTGGFKEIYYLDAVRTKSHTAFFVKEMRADARSVTLKGGDNNFIRPGGHNQSPSPKDDGFTFLPSLGSWITSGISNRSSAYPIPTLGLSEIILFQNDQISNNLLDELRESGDSHDFKLYNEFSGIRDVEFLRGDGLLDVDDLEDFNFTAYKNKAIKTVQFDHDYSLQPNTSNSFDENQTLLTDLTGLISIVEGCFTGQIADCPTVSDILNNKLGKLTLKSLKFGGKSGVSLIPPLQFGYELENPDTGSSSKGRASEGDVWYIDAEDNFKFEEGEIIKTTDNNNNIGYSTIEEVHVNFGSTLRLIQGRIPQTTDFDFVKTKNPAYNKDYYDSWGMFKSDFNKQVCGDNENFGRRRSRISAKSADVWSLRTIKNSLGSKVKIDYDSDSYGNVVTHQSLPISINSAILENSSPGTTRISFTPNTFGIPLGYYLPLGVDLDLEVPCFLVYKDANDNKLKVLRKVTITGAVEVGNVAASVAIADIEMSELYGGNIGLPNSADLYGGDIRTRSISIEDGVSFKTNTTHYKYDLNPNPEIEDSSTGTISYEPGVLDSYRILGPWDEDEAIQNFFKAEWRRAYTNSLFVNSREIPPPTVMYKQVLTRDEVHHNGDNYFLPHYSISEFEVFNQGMLGIEKDNILTWDFWDEDRFRLRVSHGRNYDEVKTRKVTIKDFTSRIGQLKKVTLYNSTTGDKVSETVNHFLHDELSDNTFETNSNAYRFLLSDFKSQGTIQESYGDARFVYDTTHAESFGPHGGYSHRIHDIFAVISRREQYPAIITGSTSTNYITGVSANTKNHAFDFYSGQLTKTSTTDSYGNVFVSESTPAYRKYDAMGLAINGGKNMLTQEAANTTYRADDENSLNPVELVSASVQTYSDLHNIMSDEDYGSNGYTINVKLKSLSDNLNQIELSDGSTIFDVGDRIQFDVGGVAKSVRIIKENDDDSYSIEWINGDPFILAPINNITAVRGNDIYRMHRTYSWIGDDLVDPETGLYPYENFVAFDAWNHGDTPPPQWQLNSEITLYDPLTHALEAKDVNGNYAATKMDDRSERVVATVANSRYYEFGYHSFDEQSLDNPTDKIPYLSFTGSGTVISNSESHTGDYSLESGSGVKGFRMYIPRDAEISPNRYNLSTWVKAGNIDDVKLAVVFCDAGGSQTSFIPVDISKGSENGWYQLNYDFGYSGGCSVRLESYNSGSGIVYWDDIRFHPVDATMTSYVYNEWGELSHILDQNNLYTRFEYDAMGRLKSTHRETFQYGEVKVSEHEINYARNSE